VERPDRGHARCGARGPDTLECALAVRSTAGDERHVEAEQFDSTEIDNYPTTVTARGSLVSIRVGILGDQPLAKLVAARIDERVRDWEARNGAAPGPAKQGR